MEKSGIIGTIAVALLAALPLAGQTDWPQGIDPATLLENTRPEPDLSGPGFAELFGGPDLDGWSVKGGAMRFEADEGVVTGTCVEGQPNGFLCTDREFGDFLFTVEFRWQTPGNSGVMFRAATRQRPDGSTLVFGYQCEMDPSDRRWTGGIYGEAMGGWKYPLTKPDAHRAARAALEDPLAWNRMTIEARGREMRTWINGVPCANLVGDEREAGFIGLQVHSGAEGVVQWRNARLKDLSTEWVDLFGDGDFSAWSRIDGRPVGNGWSFADGVVRRSAFGAGDIVTRMAFDDFELTFDWKISESGNSGVKYRTRGSLGLEYQVLDDERHSDAAEPTHRSGSLYDLVAAPDDKPLNPPGEWNSGRVVALGDRVAHWLNGSKVVDIAIGSEDWEARFGTSKYRDNEGFGSWAGPVLLQDHGDEVWYRNVRIRKLAAAAATTGE